MDSRSGGPTTCTLDLVAALNHLSCPTDILTVQAADGNGRTNSDSFIKAVPHDLKTPLQISRQCRRWLKGNPQYDLYHTNGLWMDINHATAAHAKKRSKPYVISPHGMLYPQALARSAWKKKLMLFMGHQHDISHAACIHATCHQEMEYYRQLGFQNPVAVIPNPFPIPSYVQTIMRNRDRFRIGYLGRLHPYKNIDRLIAAWAHLGPLVREGELLIMGTGDAAYVQQLKDQAASLNIHHIRFSGEVAGQDKFELLASLTALCLPSKSENFGMVVPEALIVGTPVIATRTSPWEELEEHRCGWWVSNEISSLAEHIEQCLNLSATDACAMSLRGQELVKTRYDAHQVGRQMIHMYAAILQQQTRPDYWYE